MKEITINLAECQNKEEAIGHLKRQFHLEDCQGNNLDSLWDCLGEIRLKEPLNIMISSDTDIDEPSSYQAKVESFLQTLTRVDDSYHITYLN